MLRCQNSVMCRAVSGKEQIFFSFWAHEFSQSGGNDDDGKWMIVW